MRKIFFLFFALFLLFTGCISKKDIMGEGPESKKVRLEVSGGQGEVLTGTIKTTITLKPQIDFKINTPGSYEVNLPLKNSYEFELGNWSVSGMSLKVYVDNQEITVNQSMTEGDNFFPLEL